MRAGLLVDGGSSELDFSLCMVSMTWLCCLGFVLINL
jgi:hypothetical protein